MVRLNVSNAVGSQCAYSLVGGRAHLGIKCQVVVSWAPWTAVRVWETFSVGRRGNVMRSSQSALARQPFRTVATYILKFDPGLVRHENRKIFKSSESFIDLSRLDHQTLQSPPLSSYLCLCQDTVRPQSQR